jgi:DNA-binding NarL/FixJ family response regulator
MHEISVLIADGDAYIRQCLRRAVEFDPRLRVVGEAENGLQALVLADTHQPDVVLLAAEMARMDGFEAARCLRSRRPDICIVIMSLYEEHRSRAIEAGADSFVAKDCGCSRLRSILHALLSENGPDAVE